MPRATNWLRHLHKTTANPLLTPLSNKRPPFFQGKKVNKPPPPHLSFKAPSPLSFFTNKCWTVLIITHDCKTSCGLIWDGLFINLKFGFVFDPRLHDLQRNGGFTAGADPGFFLGGDALVSCSTSTPINHIVFFFFAEYQLY